MFQEISCAYKKLTTDDEEEEDVMEVSGCFFVELAHCCSQFKMTECTAVVLVWPPVSFQMHTELNVIGAGSAIFMHLQFVAFHKH